LALNAFIPVASVDLPPFISVLICQDFAGHMPNIVKVKVKVRIRTLISDI
jgi:hypothetical protein